MTLATPSNTQLWGTMPGWGIAANLLPPEVMAARRVRALRKYIVAALVCVLVLGAAGYAYAFMQKRQAESDLAAEQARTTQLQAQQSKYAEVVQLNGSVAQIKSQVATLMTSDVDFASLVDAVLTKQPSGGTITQLQMTVTSADSSQTSVTAPAGGGVLDTSGRTQVGGISITGTTRTMPDIATYVDRLSALPGVVTVYPTSQQSGDKDATYTIQLTLTDQVLSHRFDVAPTTTQPGGN